MSLKIIRNDITKMNTEAIVNTANEKPTVGSGCDTAIFNAAGYDELLNYRKEKIGFVKEGDVFITPGFNLSAKYIIHAVSPRFTTEDETEKLVRDCYRKSLELAKKNNIKSIAFPLIAPTQDRYFHFILKQTDKIFHVGCLSRTTHCDVSHRDDRNIKAFAFQDTNLEKVVAKSHA